MAESVEQRVFRKLRELQWSGEPDGHGCGSCPDCYRIQHQGHAEGCELADILKDAPNKEAR